MATGTAPLVVIQCDAFDPALVERWIAEGALPTLAALRAGGCTAPLGGPEQIAELGAALSMYSGISRAKHGYFDYRQLRPGTYDLYPATAAAARTPPFWTHLAKRAVLVVDAAETIPVPGLRGVQLVNWTAHQAASSVVAPSAVPRSALDDAARAYGAPPRRVPEYVAQSTPADDRVALDAFLDSVRRKGALLRHLVGNGGHDLVIAGFYEGHGAAHRFWKYHRGRADGADLATGIRQVYEAIDREIALLLERLPGEANVVVVSLYGMRDEYPTEGLMDSFCRVLGYQRSPGASSGASASRLPSLADLRTRVSRALPVWAQERLLARHFRASTDWERTTAFSTPTLYTGHLYVNVRGRQPLGIVEPGEEYEEVLVRLENDLRALVDPVTGEPAIRAVHRSAALDGARVPPLLPDLFVEWTPGPHFRDRVEHPRAELRQTRPAYFRDSFHSLQGFLIASGPNVSARGTSGTVNTLDLAPSFLALFGHGPPPTMSGRPLSHLFDVATR